MMRTEHLKEDKAVVQDCLNPEDPLHKEAGMVLLRDARDGTNKFERNVKTSMRGGQVDGRVYDNVLTR